ncbi:DUF3224 domain-containing protein [Nonomuraea antimicrobica]
MISAGKARRKGRAHVIHLGRAHRGTHHLRGGAAAAGRGDAHQLRRGAHHGQAGHRSGRRGRSCGVRDAQTERFTGGIEGTGHADHVRVVQPDGSQIVAGVERIVGTIDGRSGSFVLTCYGYGDRPGAGRGFWTVVPGSGTGELAGLRGRGAFTVALGPDGTWRAEDSFTHWFDK